MLENFKEKLKKKIEENSVKSEMTWTDKKGNVRTEIVLLKRSRLPVVGDWGRIYPPINENNKINLVNLIFGGKKNLMKLLFFMAMVVLFFLAYREIATQYEALRSMACVKGCIEGVVG